MEKSMENLVGVQQIAALFGVSTRRVEQLKAEGIIKGQGKPTKYDLLPTTKAYIKYLSDKANGREKKEKDATLATEKLSAESRIKNAKAEIAELELKELKGLLHRASDVEEITTDHVMYLRSLLMAMPGKLALDLSKLNNAQEVASRISAEVYEILNQLSDYKYDPDEYHKRVMERQGWNAEREENGDESEE